MEYEPTSQPKIYHHPSLDNSRNNGGIPARQPAVNDKEPQITENTSSANENHEPIPETSRNPEDIQENPTQNSQKLPKSTQEMTHKKLKKKLTQEAKNITYAQTLTQTTQTHTDIKRQIKRLRHLNYMLWSPSSFFFSCFLFILYLTSSQNWKLSIFSLQTGGRHQMRRNQSKKRK